MSTDKIVTNINGNEYYYTQLSAKKSLLLKFTLAGIAGKALMGLAPSMGEGDKQQINAFSAAMESIFKENNPEKIIELIERIFEPAFRNGERVDIDKHYKGKFSEMYSALLWVLKMEYGDFLAEAQSIL